MRLPTRRLLREVNRRRHGSAGEPGRAGAGPTLPGPGPETRLTSCAPARSRGSSTPRAIACPGA